MSRQATQSAPPAAQDAPIVRSQHLDASLEKAHRLAMSQHHTGVTLEHLLFALTEDPEALVVLGASTVDVERLRADITTHLGQLPNDQPSGKAILPTNDLLKVLKLAATAAQQSARRQMDGAIVMAAIIGDASTPSAGMLRAHGLNFQEVIRVLQKSVAPPAAPRPVAGDVPPTQPVVTQPAPMAVSPAPAPVAEKPAPTPPPSQADAAASVPSPAAAPSQPAEAPLPSGSGLRPTTDELLASVRARLNGAAPASPRRVEPAQPAASAPPPKPAEPAAAPVERADSPTVPIVPVREEVPLTASVAARAVTEELAAPATAPAAAPPIAKAPPALPIPAAVPPPAPVPPAPEIRLEWPRTPADLVAPPAEKLPRPAAPLPVMPPPMPVDKAEVSLPSPRAAVEPTLQPPLPLVPASAQRSGPPPLPLPTVSAPPASPPAAPPRLPPMPPAAATPAASVARESQRPPPIPPPTVDLRALVQTLPRRLREGQSDIIEIVVPRRTLEIPPAAGHRWPPIRVATLRLKADPEDAHVELASPESLWISPPRVHQGADDAIWRWRVTPRAKGRIRLSLAAATRIVGSEGISAEVPLGEEFIDIDVARRGSRRGLVGLLLFGNLLAIGFLAMVLSGRAAQTINTVVKAVRSLVGG